MPRKYKSLTYARVLQAIRAGRITVDLKKLEIFKDGRLMIQRPDSTDRYLFVRIYLDGARRAVAVHRIVWMSVRRKLVPDGYDIHHRDGDRRNNRYKNLRAMTAAKHRALTARNRRTYPAGWDDVVDSEAEWEYFLTEG
jgi:hypothetical protein